MSAWIEKFINVNGFARSGKKLTGVRKIVVHYTANPGGSAENHYKYFNNLNERYASAHIFVDKTQAINIIPLGEVAYHAGDIQKRNADGTPYRGVKELLPSANSLSIGVEMCIEKDGTFHPDTIARTEDVFVELCKKFNLDPLTDIVRHRDVTWKNCPAPWVADIQLFIDFKNRVKAKLDGTKPVTSTPPSTSTLPLKKGDNGSKVSELQTLLNKKGYNLVVDGDFGVGTDAAVRDYQSKNGLTVDGIVGNATWDKLTYVAPAPEPPKTIVASPVEEEWKVVKLVSAQYGVYSEPVNKYKETADKYVGWIFIARKKQTVNGQLWYELYLGANSIGWISETLIDNVPYTWGVTKEDTVGYVHANLDKVFGTIAKGSKIAIIQEQDDKYLVISSNQPQWVPRNIVNI